MLIFCPSCNGALPERFLRRAQVEGSCPTCATSLSITLFPALFRAREKINTPGLLTGEGEASCYEHANKRAVTICNRCGRFLCTLCEVEVDGKVWCPGCLMSGSGADGAGPIQALEKQRTLFDSIALALATFPILLFFYPSIFSAPVVIYLTIRYWKRPSSIVPRGRWRFVVALIVVLIELSVVALAVIGLVIMQTGAGGSRR